MRKLYILAVAIFAITLSQPAFAINEPSFANQEKKSMPGALQGEPIRVVKLVRYSTRGNSTTSLTSGDAVVYDTVSDDGISVRRTTSSGDGAFAGITAVTILTADSNASSAFDDAGLRNWGWIVVHGPMVANAGTGGTNGNAVGDFFITSVDAGSVTTLELSRGIAGVTVDTAVMRSELKRTAAAGGFFLDAADGTSTSYEVFVENE